MNNTDTTTTALGYPRVPADAVLTVDAHNGPETWSGDRWNAYVTAAERVGELVTVTLLAQQLHTAGTVLRRAAAVIRERARAATCGAWYDAAEADLGHQVAARDGKAHYLVAQTGDGRDAEGYETCAYADMLHIAGLGPAVALKLADWLDTVERHHPHVRDAGECPSCGTGTCGPHPDTDSCHVCDQDYPCAAARPAHDLATEYLTAVGVLEPAPAAGEPPADTPTIAA